MTGAMQLALGVMTALVARERYGTGQRVHTSAYGGQLWLQQWELDGEELREGLRWAFRAKPAADWVAFLRSEPEIIYERVHSHAEVLRDPQALANDYLIELDLVGIGPARLVGPLIRFSETPVAAKGPPPLLGEHNDEIFRGLGYSEDERDAIYAATTAAALELPKATGIDPTELG